MTGSVKAVFCAKRKAFIVASVHNDNRSLQPHLLSLDVGQQITLCRLLWDTLTYDYKVHMVMTHLHWSWTHESRPSPIAEGIQTLQSRMHSMHTPSNVAAHLTTHLVASKGITLCLYKWACITQPFQYWLVWVSGQCIRRLICRPHPKLSLWLVWDHRKNNTLVQQFCDQYKVAFILPSF